MDNNQTKQPTQPTQQAAPSTPPAGRPASGGQPATNTVQQTAPEGNNNKMILWLVGGLAVVILVFGGIYFYLNSQKKTQPQPTPTPSPQVQENLEKELNAIEVNDLDAEFSTVDQDLENL